MLHERAASRAASAAACQILIWVPFPGILIAADRMLNLPRLSRLGEQLVGPESAILGADAGEPWLDEKN